MLTAFGQPIAFTVSARVPFSLAATRQIVERSGSAGNGWPIATLGDVGPRPLALTIRISDRKSTRLNSSHTVISTLSLHDALPIYSVRHPDVDAINVNGVRPADRIHGFGTRAVQFGCDAADRREERIGGKRLADCDFG